MVCPILNLKKTKKTILALISRVGIPLKKLYIPIKNKIEKVLLLGADQAIDLL